MLAEDAIKSAISNYYTKNRMLSSNLSQDLTTNTFIANSRKTDLGGASVGKIEVEFQPAAATA